jgi:NADH dehydrogenase/NADH:ubiquinone oxidoreductase subunit G
MFIIMANIALTMNGVLFSGREGMTILEVARENGIHIPTLCYLEDLPPFGACRLCVVEVEGSRTLVGSCHTPITEGMVVHTQTPKVIEARRILVELMLASHPDSCLVCDTANRCELRKIAADLDIGLPRFRIRKHYYPVEDQNPHVIRDMSKCIMCHRCVAACLNIKGDAMFSVAYRGFNSKVIYGLDQPVGSEEACHDCDICVSLCPTGALTKPTPIGEKKEGPALFVTG